MLLVVIFYYNLEVVPVFLSDGGNCSALGVLYAIYLNILMKFVCFYYRTRKAIPPTREILQVTIVGRCHLPTNLSYSWFTEMRLEKC